MIFERISGVLRRCFYQSKTGAVPEFLAFEVTSEYLGLLFAGHEAIRVNFEVLLCHASTLAGHCLLSGVPRMGNTPVVSAKVCGRR